MDGVGGGVTRMYECRPDDSAPPWYSIITKEEGIGRYRLEPSLAIASLKPIRNSRNADRHEPRRHSQHRHG